MRILRPRTRLKRRFELEKIRLVRREGGSSRVLTITDILPKEWVAVNATVIKASAKELTVKISKVK